MSIRVMTDVWQYSKQKGSSLLLMLAIADFSHDDGTGAWPSISTLSKKLRMSERNVQLLIRQAQETGELHVQERIGPFVNLYRIIINSGMVKSFHDEAGFRGGEDCHGEKSGSHGEIQSINMVKPTSPNTLIEPLKNHHSHARTFVRSMTAEEYIAWARIGADAWRDILPLDSFPNVESVAAEINRALEWLRVQPLSKRKCRMDKFLRLWLETADARLKFRKQDRADPDYVEGTLPKRIVTEEELRVLLGGDDVRPIAQT